uniref:BPTI/Kunitz inhibitor domain-containing protein n=1 Tax=Rodentolepis nana TaxID=102285 RepID=A0A0R3T9W4_RODNA
LTFRLCLRNNICRLPKDTGPCKGGHARYYYDPNTAKCRLFMYGGCLGNGNRFTTKVECEEACGAMSEVYDTGAPPAKVNEASGVQVQKAPQVPVEVFEEMRRITVMYSERYREFNLHRNENVIMKAILQEK